MRLVRVKDAKCEEIIKTRNMKLVKILPVIGEDHDI